MDRGAWWATVHGVPKSGTAEQLSTRMCMCVLSLSLSLTHTHTHAQSIAQHDAFHREVLSRPS